MPATYRICFVCSGNICRSPSAEAVLRRLVDRAGLAGRVEIDSAGLGRWHAGDDADRRSLKVLRGRGYRLDGHRARLFTAADFADHDLVVALDRGHERALRRLAPTAEDATKVRLLRSYDPAASDDQDVPDPYYGGPRGFEDVLDVIEAACGGMLADLRSHP